MKNDNIIYVSAKANEYSLELFNEIYKEFIDNELNVKNSEYLFLNKNGGSLTERGIRYILDKIIKGLKEKKFKCYV